MYHNSGAPRRAPSEEEERRQQHAPPPPPPPAMHPPAYQQASPSLGAAHPAASGYHGYSPPNGSHAPSSYSPSNDRHPAAANYSAPSDRHAAASYSPPGDRHATAGYSPSNGAHPPPAYSPNGSHPTSSYYAARPPPGSPSRAAMPKPTTFYDPTSEHREPRSEAGWSYSRDEEGRYAHDRPAYDTPSQDRRPPRSPTTGGSQYPPLASPTYPNHPSHLPPRTEPASPRHSHLPPREPTSPHHTHMPPREPASPLHSHMPPRNEPASPHLNQLSSRTEPASPTYPAHPAQRAPHSPTRTPKSQSSIALLVNGTVSEDVKPAPVEEAKLTRADPMSFSSILSGPSTASAAPPPAQAATPPPAPKPRSTPKVTNGDATPASVPPAATSATKKPRKIKEGTPGKDGQKPRSKPPKKVTTAALEEAMRQIDNLREADLDLADLAQMERNFGKENQKRERKVEEDEELSRKKRRTFVASRTAQRIDKSVIAARDAFRTKFEDSVIGEVQQQEVMDEKERKKDMQRKRRREKTIHTETEKLKAIRERYEKSTDHREREKLGKDHQKALKKVVTTKRVLDTNSALPDDLDEAVAPLPVNLDDGAVGTLNGASPEPTRGRRGKGPGNRLKKSKEQKQAEKDKAYNAAMESSPVPIAPKEEKRKEAPTKDEAKPKRRKVDKKALDEDGAPAPPQTTYSSKGYHQIYEQIWKDIARKDVPKVYRIKEQSLTTKQSNLRKTAQLASKEARRWQLRTNKSTKDTQARAKRCMREMMGFWKQNEREERDSRRTAEKAELEAAKKAEAEREANRQRRKLEFLINQTELYSHFIGKKVRTDEVERSTDSHDVGVSQETVQKGDPDAPVVDLPSEEGPTGVKVTNFEDLDFDDGNDAQLQAAARANAQHAVQEAQNKARAFNEGGEAIQAQFDDGELNFQNPTGLSQTDIEQPKMLTCQLKEYQLKGLNWLVNLYEQGINGILADEMGLGKTVQSISVMSYLAEKHNIWGPFLVIAPSSTLHNWQQEIARFVPNLKVVPYWGSAKDRKVLRKFWDRKHITYNKDSEFHVLITSYQLVVQDTSYFQKMRWQYMILDEAQAIKSSQSSRWKNLLAFHCRNRLLLTGTPIQNNMQELWALLHFIMPSLFDSHDEFSEWFSRDIESHAQSNSKLNEDQLKRLHMILKPFMLRRVKKHVQKELGDKVEKDVFCDLTYRQRAFYANLRNKISIMDLIEQATLGGDEGSQTLMNLVMQFRKVCNHPDLFERAEIRSPMSMAYFAETASFVREGQKVNVGYSTRNLIDFDLPRLICSPEGLVDEAGPGNARAGFRHRYLGELMNIWTPENIVQSSEKSQAFSWLRFVTTTASEAYDASHHDVFARAVRTPDQSILGQLGVVYEDADSFTPKHSMLNIVDRNPRRPLAEVSSEGYMKNLLNVSRASFARTGLNVIEQCARPAADAPPITVSCSNQSAGAHQANVMFNTSMRTALSPLSHKSELTLIDAKCNPADVPAHDLLPAPISSKARYTNIEVPSMRRFVTDSGKLGKLDQLLRTLKEEGHRVLLYFQMTRMIDLMEEYLTYRNYKYLRLDGSTKLEDRRDTVHDFQTRPDIFVFLLSTRAGGLGINLTAADTVIFYDSDWNPTIDSQAMDRAHRLGQTKQVTVYRMITRGTIEERIRARALQKEEVQRVVISGGSGVDFNTRNKADKTKDMAMWLADDDQAEEIERKAKEMEERANDPAFKKSRKKAPQQQKKKDLSMDDMYHEGEGHFDDGSAKPSAAGTPMDSDSNVGAAKRGRNLAKKAKTAKQRLAMADGGD